MNNVGGQTNMTALLLVFVLALLLFGPKKTYTLALEMGRYAGMLKRTARDLQHQFDLTAIEPVSNFPASPGAQQVILSPSNVTVPGRRVEEISDPQALTESPTTLSGGEEKVCDTPAGAH